MKRVGLWAVSGMMLFWLAGAADARGEPAASVVAVFDVETKGVKLTDEERERLGDFLASKLAESGLFQVVPRAQLQQRLLEQKTSSHKACYDQACQVELGRELATQKTISTQVIQLGSQCAVTVTLYDLKKAASERGATVQGPCDLDGIVASLDQAAGQLGGKKAPPASSAPPPPATAPQARAEAPPASDVPGMVKFEAGEFWMGCDPRAEPGCPEDEQPGRKVSLDAFYLDRTEVTVGHYEACVKAGKCAAITMHRECARLKLCPRGHDPERGYNWGQSGRDTHPANGVSWNQAKGYCAWLGKRLPTEAEWERAARGTSGRRYPWGTQDPTCDRAILNDPAWGCGMSTTWPVCSRQPGNTPEGVCDLAGNVAEWTADVYARTAYRDTPSRNPSRDSGGLERTARGGSLADSAASLRAARREKRWPGNFEATQGFRCARDATPTKPAK